MVRSTYNAVPKLVIFVEKVAEDAELELSVTPLEPAQLYDVAPPIFSTTGAGSDTVTELLLQTSV